MRKLSLVLMVVAMLVMAVMPAAAQDEEPGTIADIVVASATGDTPEFATLLTAVQAADPAVLEALSDPEAEFTVFAPTDAAFAALAEELGEEAFGEILADTEALTGILLFHVIEGAIFSEDLVAALDENDGVASAETLNGQYLDAFGGSEDTLEIENALLNMEMIDIEASNGVIHVIDAVLLPETATIAEIVIEVASEEDEDFREFTTLLAAVQAADPAVLELLSDPEAELTVFAPTDAAFAALAEALGEEAFNGILADPATLTNILQYHVIAGVVHSGDVEELLFGDDMMEDDMDDMEEGEEEGEEMEEEMMEPVSIEVEMANGAMATVTFSDEGLFINDAQIIFTDVDAANGVIHLIDAVIVPPSE